MCSLWKLRRTDVIHLYNVFRQVIGRWFDSDQSPGFGISETLPVHTQRSIISRALHMARNTLEINLITYVSFFHQKLVILSGPGALQFFFYRIVSQHISFVTLRSPSSTFGIICLNFSSISFNQCTSGFPESACSRRFRQKFSTSSAFSKYFFSATFSSWTGISFSGSSSIHDRNLSKIVFWSLWNSAFNLRDFSFRNFRFLFFAK